MVVIIQVFMCCPLYFFWLLWEHAAAISKMSELNFVTNGQTQETLHMKTCVYLHHIIAALYKQDMPCS